MNSRRAVAVLHYAPIVGTVEDEPSKFIPSSGARALQRPLTASKYAPSCMIMRIAGSMRAARRPERECTTSPHAFPIGQGRYGHHRGGIST